jgi:hypothetical protein
LFVYLFFDRYEGVGNCQKRLNGIHNRLSQNLNF